MGCRGSHHWSKVTGASPFDCCFFHAPQAAAPANLFIASFRISSVQLKRRQRFTQESAAGVLLQSSAAPITRTHHASPQRGDQQLKSIKMHQDASRAELLRHIFHRARAAFFFWPSPLFQTWLCLWFLNLFQLKFWPQLCKYMGRSRQTCHGLARLWCGNQATLAAFS